MSIEMIQWLSRAFTEQLGRNTSGLREAESSATGDVVQFEALEPRLLLSTTYTVPTSITYDGSAEVTQDLLDYFANTVTDGTEGDPNTVVFQQNGTYWIDGTLEIADRHHLIFDGNGATFEAQDDIDPATNSQLAYKRDQWRITSESSDITLQDMTIYGAHENAGMNGAYDSSREGQAGVALENNAHDITLDNLTISYTYGDLIEGLSQAHDIVVTNSTLEHSGRQGISFNFNTDVLFKDNYLDDAKRSLIDIEPYASTWKVDHLRIVGNTTGSATNRWLSLGGSGYTGSVYVAENIIQGDAPACPSSWMTATVATTPGAARSSWPTTPSPPQIAATSRAI